MKVKFDITIVDVDDKAPKRARVTLRRMDADADAEEVVATLDPATGRFSGEAAPGRYEIHASASRLEATVQPFTLSHAAASEFVVLGKSGAPFYYRGQAKVPFHREAGKVGARILPGHDFKTIETAMRNLAKRLGIKLDKTTPALAAEQIRLFSTDASVGSEKLDELITRIAEHELVRDAGLAINRGGHISILTSQVAVRFAPDVKDAEVAVLAKRLALRSLRPIPYVANGWLMTLDKPAGVALLLVCASLVKSGRVEYAEPNLIEVVEDLAINPTDYLYAEQWHIPLVSLPDAWETLRNTNAAGVNPGDPGDLTFGGEDVVIAILDRGIQSATVAGNVAAVHPDFADNVTGGASKVATFFDFATMQPNNDAPPNDHGMGCASVAAARANNPAIVTGISEGCVGAAPNCRLLGAIRPSGGTNQQYADAFIWMAGFNPGWTADGVNYLVTTTFPGLNPNPADIISNSFTWSSGALSGVMRDMIDWVTSYGRDGRGTSIFWAAGNGNTVCNFGTATHPKVFAVAASSLANDGTTEVRASYSNFGNAIEFCAPSHDAYVGSSIVHNPPTNYGVIASDLLNGGNMPGNPAQQSSLSAAATAGTANLTLASSAGFAVGQAALVGVAGAAGTEATMVQAIVSATEIRVAPLLNAHPVGTVIAASAANHKNNFGGTSSATPFAAGIAALCLSVNPALSWVELRQILRTTATQIDASNTNVVGQWVDTTGDTVPNFSQWYGWGRLNADAAVIAARDYNSNVDVVVRDNLNDVGAVPSPGWHAASPDIWVRQSDDPIPTLAYTAAPPHQSAKRGEPNHVYVRVANVGTAASSDIFVRAMISHYPGFEFRYPNEWMPSNLPGQPVPNPLVPGSYLIGEANVASLAAGANQILKFTWPANLVPPKTVVVAGMSVQWHPCLLAEASPHDGPLPTGTSLDVKDYNNIAHRNITIEDADDEDSDLAVAMVAGTSAPAGLDAVLVDRSLLPADYRVFLRSADETVMKRWIQLVREGAVAAAAPLPGSRVVLGDDDDRHSEGKSGLAACLDADNDCGLVLVDKARVGIRCGSHGMVVVHGMPGTRFSLCCAAKQNRPRLSVGKVQGREVIFFEAGARAIQLPLRMAPGQYQALVLGMSRPAGRRGAGKLFATQLRADGELSAGYTIQG